LLADSHQSSEPRITILYLLYPRGPGYQKEKPIRELHRILSRLPGHKTVVYIDNSASEAPVEMLSDNEYAISGDNTYLEFSGWQRGLDFLRNRRLSGDVCLFANDTLLAQSWFHRRMLNQAVVECAYRHRAMVGQRMSLRATGEIMGNLLIPYVRTHLFLLPQAVVDELGSVVSLDGHSIDRMLLPAYDPSIHLFQPDAPVSKSIREYLLFHLHSSWHRKQPYCAGRFDELRGKAISILNAILLSMRVHGMGYPLVSFANASRRLRIDPAPARLRAEWIDGYGQIPTTGKTAFNKFWQPDLAFYQRIPGKMRAFSLENVLDFLERREHPEHL
jgi:hypothetical protein